MNFSSFDEMQKAVDVVKDSQHPTSKVAATTFGTDKDRQEFSISRTNYWPKLIEERIGKDLKIGNSSGTIHAETASVLAAPFTDGASLCVTDPFCPNCAKNIAEAGIKTIYIDHKGFEKDFAARRGMQFKNMSMRICERAGINVFEIHRKEKNLKPIIEIPETFVPAEDAPVEIEELNEANDSSLKSLIDLKSEKHRGRKFAVAIAENYRGQIFGLCARAHPAIGYTMLTDFDEIEHPDGKYSFIQEPVNRILMNTPRYGLKIINGLMFSSQLPTSREQVNIVGAGIDNIQIKYLNKARDDHAVKAMEQLIRANILAFNKL